VMSDEAVTAGEQVLTSGGDRIFPKGLVVGRVTKVVPGKDLFLDIRVKPAANLGKLEEVLVVTRIDEKQSEPDQTGTARAADILASRLPSVPPKPAEAPAAAASPAVKATPGASPTAKPEAQPKTATTEGGKPAATQPPASASAPATATPSATKPAVSKPPMAKPPVSAASGETPVGRPTAKPVKADAEVKPTTEDTPH